MEASIGPILIVDDEPINLATLKQILQSDYPLVFACSGADCLAAVKKHNPALILLDVQMPDMDGYTVCKILKSDPQTESIPVIFISALGEVGDETAGFESGGVDYIVKPVSPTLVHARVRTHLSLVNAVVLERYVKQLEIERAKTARLSRIHAILSGTNFAIVRIQEPHVLYEEACRIAVDEGGFGIAWIAITTSNTGALSIATTHGVERDDLERSLGLADDATIKSDIFHQVLNTAKAVDCNNEFMQGPHDRMCLDAKNRGYDSIVALPLLLAEVVTGVMVLYAREKNFFDDQELKLLNELAGDISFALQSIENKKRANFLSFYDALTELPNTTLFLDRLEQSIQSARREHGVVCAISINVDRFKLINDNFGRNNGDIVLKVIAARLDAELEGAFSVARIGADNFALICEHESHEDIGAFCEDLIDLLQSPVTLTDLNIDVSVRMGVAVFPSDADDAESLFKNSEIALKEAKTANARYLFYSAEINAMMAEKIELERMIKNAITDEQFLLHYQPKVDLKTGRIIGAEALIRWQHPSRGLVGPYEFIPLAEETGLIVPLGAWVIKTVCAQQASWQRDAVPMVPVAVNLSALQFREGDVLEVVQNCLIDQKLNAQWLQLELTETLVMQNLEAAEQTMRSFRELGLHLSLDDFGTGYSSLAYLKRLPFDTVKIDRAFITDITVNSEDAAIASAIIGMAHSLGMKVVAEGVETEAQLKFLIAKNCDQMQGYFFSRPVPAEDFKTMLCVDKKLASDIGNPVN